MLELETMIFRNTRYSLIELDECFTAIERLPRLLDNKCMLFCPDGEWEVVVDIYGNSQYAVLIAPIINQILTLQLVVRQDETFRVIHMSHSIAGGVLPIIDWIDYQDIDIAKIAFKSKFYNYTKCDWILRGFPTGDEDLSKHNSWAVCGLGSPYINIDNEFSRQLIYKRESLYFTKNIKSIFC